MDKKKSSSSSSSSKACHIPRFDDGVPRSVRHAPPELHAEIRRRQNVESARRSRNRDRSERDMMERKYEENQRRISKLEKAVDDLTKELER